MTRQKLAAMIRCCREQEHLLTQLSDGVLPEEEDRIVSDLAGRAEKQAMDCRNMLRIVPEYRLPETAEDKGNVSFQVLPGNILRITMPRLIPRKRQNQVNIHRFYETEYLGDFYRFGESGIYRCAERNVLWFRHYYAVPGTLRTVVDHDNYESKTVTDMITRSLGIDDAPQYCETFVSTYTDTEKDKTEILLIPKDGFIRAYEKYSEGM